MLLEPQIYLRNGQMVLTGIIQQSGLNADLEMIMDVGVTPDGKPDISLSLSNGRLVLTATRYARKYICTDKVCL